MLSDSDSDGDDLHTLTINQHYAKAFEYKKEREELAKLKEKYGSDFSGSGASDDDDSEDSEDTEEDSDGEELTPAVDAAILRMLALIKKRDPAIYENERRVFEEEHTRTQEKAPAIISKTKEKSKPLTIREAKLASVLAVTDSHSRSPTPESRPLTHTEEQALLRSETRAAFYSATETQGDDDDLLILRSRTRDEIELEEQEYKTFLEREVGEDIRDLVTVETNETVDAILDIKGVGDDDKSREGAKKKKGKREREKEQAQGNGQMQNKKVIQPFDENFKKETDHEFLMNYIFNRGWIERSNRRVPTYNEIIDVSPKRSKRESAKLEHDSDDSDGMDLLDEDSFDDLADAFETSYNFRFEEPGGSLVTTFPRNVPSVRRESTTRKDARVRKKERQVAEKQALLEERRSKIRSERALVEIAVAEDDKGDLVTDTLDPEKRKTKKQQRREELARMGFLKANELRRKLEMVSSEGGLSGMGDEALAHLDLDTDWDPAKHDAQMAELYRGDGDIVDDGDAEKPVWEDDINIDDIELPPNAKSKAELKRLRKKEKKKSKDADVDIGVDVDEMDADLKVGASWSDWEDGEEWRGTEEERKRKADAYMDEVVNSLGFNGITSHMPTRFHYVPTTHEDYGLTPTEILLATDAELNSYIGLRKLAPYRIDKGGKAKKSWDPTRVQRLKEFRKNLHSRMGSKNEGPWSIDVGANSTTRTTEGHVEKKKRMGKKERAKLRIIQGENAGDSGFPEIVDKPKKRGRDTSDNSECHADYTELDVKNGARKRRRRRRRKESDSVEVDTVGIS